MSGDHRVWSKGPGDTTLHAAPSFGIEVDSDVLPPLRVLIADDYPDAAESVALLLAGLRVETRLAEDGEAALTIAQEWRPELCVLDLEMPKMDGCEVARRIRALRGEYRPLLIAFSGWTGSEHKRSALQAGFDHYLMKPVEPQKLMRIIRSFQRARFR
ncbi:MAG TPA: response regulator [Steroidobacteraceae bacterium]|nr:response regulator [Steroidobacteraceae bacterium]